MRVNYSKLQKINEKFVFKDYVLDNIKSLIKKLKSYIKKRVNFEKRINFQKKSIKIFKIFKKLLLKMSSRGFEPRLSGNFKVTYILTRKFLCRSQVCYPLHHEP
jgi:hypothetical protein